MARTRATTRRWVAWTSATLLIAFVLYSAHNQQGRVEPHDLVRYSAVMDGCSVDICEAYNPASYRDDRTIILHPESMSFTEFSLVTALDFDADGQWDSFSRRNEKGIFAHMKSVNGEWAGPLSNKETTNIIDRLNRAVSHLRRNAVAKQ